MLGLSSVALVALVVALATGRTPSAVLCLAAAIGPLCAIGLAVTVRRRSHGGPGDKALEAVTSRLEILFAVVTVICLVFAGVDRHHH
jgi:hypothetical protein